MICFWIPGTLSSGSLDAEIAARDHQRVGIFDDRGETLDRLRLLDLGEHPGMAARHLLDLRQILGPLDEGERDPVDVDIERRFEVGAVLGRQRAEADGRIGNVDALAIGKAGADLDGGDRPGLRALRHLEADLAVVEEEAVPGLERREDFGMGQFDAAGVAGARIGIEGEGMAGLERDRMLAEGTDPEFRALQVDQDADRPAAVRFDRADIADQIPQPRVIGMAHIDAEDVRTGLEQAPDLSLLR